MMRDWCTWDNEYNDLVQSLRAKLVSLGGRNHDDYTTVLMQGSGTFSVEAVIGSVVPEDGKLVVLTNGAYGNRIAQISKVLKVNTVVVDFGEVGQAEPEKLREVLEGDPEITHVAVVHCETTTGMLNPIEEIGKVVKSFGKIYIVDAMSSFPSSSLLKAHTSAQWQGTAPRPDCVPDDSPPDEPAPPFPKLSDGNSRAGEFH